MSIICRKTLPSAGYKMLSVFLILIRSFLEELNPSELNSNAWHNTKSKRLGSDGNWMQLFPNVFLISTKEGSCLWVMAKVQLSRATTELTGHLLWKASIQNGTPKPSMERELYSGWYRQEGYVENDALPEIWCVLGFTYTLLLQVAEHNSTQPEKKKKEGKEFLREKQGNLMEPNSRNIAGSEEGTGRRDRKGLRSVFPSLICTYLFIIFMLLSAHCLSWLPILHGRKCVHPTSPKFTC